MEVETTLECPEIPMDTIRVLYIFICMCCVCAVHVHVCVQKCPLKIHNAPNTTIITKTNNRQKGELVTVEITILDKLYSIKRVDFQLILSIY